MKVSVIVPAYNHEAYIAETIRGVLDQSFGDFELIVINDGSTDNTEEEILKFGDSRIKYIFHSLSASRWLVRYQALTKHISLLATSRISSRQTNRLRPEGTHISRTVHPLCCNRAFHLEVAVPQRADTNVELTIPVVFEDHAKQIERAY